MDTYTVGGRTNKQMMDGTTDRLSAVSYYRFHVDLHANPCRPPIFFEPDTIASQRY